MTEHFDLTNLPPKPGGALDLPDEPAAASTLASGVSTYVDDEVVTAQRKTDLDLLAADLADAQHDNTVVIPVAGREGYAVRFLADVSGPEIEAYRHKARTSNGQSFDEVKFDKLVIANKAVEIILRDDVMRDGEGNPLNFRHRALLDLLKVANATDAVKSFYVRDGIINSVSNAVIAASGWGQQQAPDPTSGG